MMKVNYILVLCFLWGGIARSATGNDYPQYESTLKYIPGAVRTESGIGHATTTNQNGHFSQDPHSNVKRPPRQYYGDDPFVNPSDDPSSVTSNIGTTARPLTVTGSAKVDLISPSTTNSSEFLSSANATSKTPKHPKIICPRHELDKCLTQMPPMGNLGIPSSPAAVQTACKAFDVGMNCVDEWAKKCLGKSGQEKMKQSVRGAHETFTFLCRDKTFRAEYLKNGECYRRISPLWDRCSIEFIERLRKYGTKENSTTLCCVRIEYLKCVTEVAHLHCTVDAAKFLQRMAETLVRSTMQTHAPHHCVNYSHRNCTMVNGSPSVSLWEWTNNFPINSNSILKINMSHIIIATQFVLIHSFYSIFFDI